MVGPCREHRGLTLYHRASGRGSASANLGGVLPGFSGVAVHAKHLTVPTDKGANAGLKVASLVAGMVAGADSIDDMALLRHGGMGRVFANAYAPSTLGSFLRAFSFGHVRQLDAVASRFLARLAARPRWSPRRPTLASG